MKHTKPKGPMFVLTVIVCSVLFGITLPAGAQTSHILPEYVAKGDDWYGWTLAEERELDNDIRVVRIDMTSHLWHDIPWDHRLLIIIPNVETEPKAGIMLIAGSGSGHDEVKLLAPLVEELGVPVGVLLDIPNQPLYGGKNEDELIAYTFQQFIDTHDASWPLLLPMVQGAVKGMDVFQAAMLDEYDWEIEQFVVAGASKRGWTTWLTPVVDERVAGIVPIVYNNLDLVAQMALHEKTFAGGTSPKIDDYAELGLHQVLDEDVGLQLRDIVDPYAYIEQINVPKLLVNGTNDEYWPVDALNVYVDDLVGETYITYVPNGGHSLGGEPERILPTIVQFFHHVIEQPILPSADDWYTVEHTDEAIAVRVQSDDIVHTPSLWMALSITRDFSQATWSELPMQQEQDGWVAAPRPMANMYVAFFVSAELATSNGNTVRYDTPITLMKGNEVLLP